MPRKCLASGRGHVVIMRSDLKPDRSEDVQRKADESPGESPSLAVANYTDVQVQTSVLQTLPTRIVSATVSCTMQALINKTSTYCSQLR